MLRNKFTAANLIAGLFIYASKVAFKTVSLRDNPLCYSLSTPKVEITLSNNPSAEYVSIAERRSYSVGLPFDSNCFILLTRV